MIAYFPLPEQDELLAGLCGRFVEQLHLPSQKAAVELLFGPGAVVVYDLPSRLTHLRSQLPPNFPLTAEEFLQRTTFFPLYAPFLEERLRARLKMAMLADGGKAIPFLSGSMAHRLQTPAELRFCVLCAEADREKRGHSWWRRSHQLPGLTVCPLHNCSLTSNGIARTARGNRTSFPAPPPECAFAGKPLAHDNPQLRLARTAQTLLLGSSCNIGPSQLRQAYVEALQELDLASASGRIALRDLHDCFVTRYPRDLLYQLGSSFDSQINCSWLSRLARKPKRTQAPMRHLLLMDFLQIPIEELFANAIKGNAPPLRREPKRLGVGRGRPKIFDPVMLKRLWMDSTLSLRSISRQLGLDPLTVKRKALKGGLRFPRVGPRITNAPIPSEIPTRRRRTVETLRRRWAHALERGSHRPLRRRLSRTYNWLFKHDRDWLRDHRPSGRNVKVHQEQRRARWKARDVYIESLVPAVGHQLRKRRHLRVSRTGIARALGIETMLRKHPTHLPLTAAAIARHEETRIEHALRRLNEVRRSEPSIIARRSWSSILRRAGIRPELASDPIVSKALLGIDSANGKDSVAAWVD